MNKRRSLLRRGFLSCLLLLLAFAPSVVAVAADTGSPASEQSKETFGPFEALVRNDEIVKDVKVAEDGNIFLKLNPEFRDQAITVRISMQKSGAYRKWFNGSEDLVSPAFSGKELNGWTDRVQTTANYIEYWMDGALILHLHRIR